MHGAGSPRAVVFHLRLCCSCAGSSSTDALMVVSEEAEKEYRDTEALVQTLSEYESILRQVAVAGSGSAGER